MRGLPFFPQYGATLASQLWIAQRFMFASSFVLATLFINKKLNAVLLYYLYMAFTGLILLAIYVWKIFPVTFVRDTGLTAFKIGSEYVIIALLGVATYLLWYNRKKFGRETYLLLFIALAISIVVEFMFTLYRSVTSLITIEAHMLLLLSYYFILQGAHRNRTYEAVQSPVSRGTETERKKRRTVKRHEPRTEESPYLH
jgi:hypothetical protein